MSEVGDVEGRSDGHLIKVVEVLDGGEASLALPRLLLQRIIRTVEETIIEAGEQHAKGIGWLLSSDKLPEFIEVLRTMGMYEKFRGEEVA